MRILRNRELIIYISVILAQAVLAGWCFNIGKEYRLVPYFILICIVTEIFLFTLKWYREIRKLSDYLTRIQNVNNDNDMKDIYEYLTMDSYKEGELSILKTEVYKVTRMLVEQKERLKEDKVFLADSLADISHQLKTPLTSLTVMADLIGDETLSADKRQEFIKNIHIQLNRIDWLVATLLKMSKLDAGTVKMNPAKTNMRQLIEKSFNHLLIPMELKNQMFEITGNDKDECICDKNWTAEALSNIGKNCIEHTGNGGIIKVLFEDNSIYSKIIISDNGNGITKEDLPHIFERFYKGKNSSKDSIGIGLAFAKQIISMENGIIEVTSDEGKGTQFTIRLYKLIV